MSDKPSLSSERFKTVALDALETCTRFLEAFPDLTCVMEIKMSNGQIVVVGIKDEDNPPEL